MYSRLLAVNESSGKTTLEELYAMTPREADTIIAGGEQCSLDRMSNERFILSSTMLPAVMIDPEKFSSENADQALHKMQHRIDAMTDRKVQEQIKQQKQEQKRFISLFGLAHKKGG